jgi:hypothetical protein
LHFSYEREYTNVVKLVPKRWFSWDFRLEGAAGLPAVEIILSAWRERGSVAVAGVQYRISRDGFTGPFILENAGRQMARAVKRSAFRQEFIVSHQGNEYTLKRTSWWRPDFGVFSGTRRIGTIARESWWTRRASVTLPEPMPVWLQAFIVWLTALMWKRDADAAATGAPST